MISGFGYLGAGGAGGGARGVVSGIDDTSASGPLISGIFDTRFQVPPGFGYLGAGGAEGGVRTF